MMMGGRVHPFPGDPETKMATRNTPRRVVESTEGPSTPPEIREEALARLYRRKRLLDSLIRSLEAYQTQRAGKRAPIITLRPGRPRS